jgi:hypothetical protein
MTIGIVEIASFEFERGIERPFNWSIVDPMARAEPPRFRGDAPIARIREPQLDEIDQSGRPPARGRVTQCGLLVRRVKPIWRSDDLEHEHLRHDAGRRDDHARRDERHMSPVTAPGCGQGRRRE